MKNSNKKGFTIVELVIVIAVIAILAAVLIPTFSNITEKSRVASDMTMIRNINTGLQADEALHGKPGTMHEALEIALNMGYKLENIEPISESEVIYDSKNNRFALIDKNGKLVFGEDTTKAITEGSESGDKRLLWKIAKADADVDTILNDGYSVYLANTEIAGREIALSGLGFDVGDNAKAFTVTYSGGNCETVIRTNIASTLTINAENDTVNHYGAVDTLTITAIASESYHEFGFVKTVGTMGSGRFVAEGTAKFHQKKDEISFGSMTFEEKSGVIYGEHLSVIDGKYTCCGADANQHEHTWELDSEKSSPAKCAETGVNVYKCTVDGCEANKVETLPALGHLWNEGEITTQPTETKEGVKTFTCTRCHETKTEGIPKLDHVHAKGEYVAEVPATCEKAGTKGYYTCTGCSTKFEDEELKTAITDLTIPALGHDMPNDWTIKEETCTTSGEKTKTCSRCDHKETETIPAKGHDLTETTIAATCAADGKKTTTCSRCDYKHEDIIPKLTTHTWDSGKVTKEATCGEKGVETFTCTVCKTTKTEDINATGKHVYGEWTITDDKHSHICTVCNHGEEGNHNFGTDNKCTVCECDKPVAKVESADDLINAIASAEDGATITLGANITRTRAFTISKKIIIIDLNGFTLSSTARNTLILENDADVTIVDSNGNGKITNDYAKNAAETTTVLLKNGAKFTLESGTVQSHSYDYLHSVAIASSSTNGSLVECKVNINGGTVSNRSGHVKSRAIVASNGMTVNINGGTIDGGQWALAVYVGSVSNIYGGRLFANGKDGRTDEYGTTYAIYAKGEATITIGSESSDSRPEVRGIKFEDSGVSTELPTIKLVKGDITNPIYSKEDEDNYYLFKLVIDADADVTFSDDTAKYFLKDGLGIYDTDENGKILYNESGKRYYIVTTERQTA